MEIVPGLHQLKVPIPNNPVGYVLPYLFEVPNGFTIVDPGWNADESVESLRGQLAELGTSFADLRQIVVTHIHPDHYGMAGRLRSETGAQIIVHEKELDLIHSRANSGPATPEWLLESGMPAAEVAGLDRSRLMRGWQTDTEPDSTMADDEVLKLGRFSLRVIWTPGHAPGHACFYDAERELLLSGDHVLPTISPNVSFRPGSAEDPLGDYLHSIKKLRGLAVKRVLPAHEYSFDDLEGRLDELEEHHAARLQEMYDAVVQGAESAYEVAWKIRWNIGSFESFNAWTRQAAVGETLAHLNHLVRVNRLRSSTAGGLVRYARA